MLVRFEYPNSIECQAAKATPTGGEITPRRLKSSRPMPILYLRVIDDKGEATFGILTLSPTTGKLVLTNIDIDDEEAPAPERGAENG